MTREIKFRAWNIKNKSMIDEVLEMGFGCRHYPETWLIGDDQRTDHFKLMQYTGLKDKNGKEIYEGDIVEYIDRSPVIPEQRTAIVKFIGGNVDYANNLLISPFVNIGNFNYKTNFIMGTLNNPAESIIIGNIYQNPELLGGENE